ncbi:hypothetical protein [Sporosarcina cyprini]|uniref:hypothetical protein n=1 Tax=Sporosarcina cyprini TaxID=2910523 RepID=UPI001EDFCA73|nr:hypothetical protein [Sporosarcina cyprini]MCG3087065.1 hypothetical protein [Sporosarcina cyprini]
MLLTNQEIDWMVEILSVWKRYELFGHIYEWLETRYELSQDYTSGLQQDTSCSRIIRVVGAEIRAVLEIYERLGIEMLTAFN